MVCVCVTLVHCCVYIKTWYRINHCPTNQDVPSFNFSSAESGPHSLFLFYRAVVRITTKMYKNHFGCPNSFIWQQIPVVFANTENACVPVFYMEVYPFTLCEMIHNVTERLLTRLVSLNPNNFLSEFYFSAL